MRRIQPVLFLALLISAAIFAYLPGLKGGFLFDDFPNLKPLGDLRGVGDWASLTSYALGGFSGPTGRPLSLLSFLVNDNAWPSVAWSFKYTNLCLHLICGLLLAWVVYLMLLILDFREVRATWIALLTAGLWMLHPYWASTTLYVVQRMAILSCLFMLAGMVGYLKGRMWLVQPDRHRPWAAYAMMSVSAGAGTLLALLSKENGALLPLLLLVVEVFFWRMNVRAPINKFWLAIVLGLPSLVILLFLARHVDFRSDIWPNRPFNQVERLLSETRIMWTYLGQLWMPGIEGSGLYHDGFEVSRNFVTPVSTMWASLAWVGLFLALPWLYRRLPFVWLALVFFLCGHLIESTVIGLELYFEHRNYAPALFMFLPLAIGVDWLGRNYTRWLAVMVALLLLTMLAGMTWHRSKLWGDADQLQVYWAMKNPNSARARTYLIGRFVADGKYAEAFSMADASIKELNGSSLMTMSWLQLRVNFEQATDEDFERAIGLLIQQTFDAQAVAGLRTMVDSIVAEPRLAKYRVPMLNMMSALSDRGAYRKSPLFLRVTAYNRARLYLAMGEVQEAKRHYLEAMNRYGLASSAMQMFAEMAGAGHYEAAQELLQAIRQGIESGGLAVGPLGKQYYLMEVDRMQSLLSRDMGDK